MDDLDKNNKKEVELSPEDQERIRKNFLDELELLREKEREIVKRFGLKIEGTFPTISSEKEEKEFDFDENLNFFLDELLESEKKIYREKGAFSQAALNQSISKLRILKEKAQNLLNKIKNNDKENAQNLEEEWKPF